MSEPDWADVQRGQLNLAELVWAYHQALLASGFDEDRALYFSTAYQEQLVNVVVFGPRIEVAE